MIARLTADTQRDLLRGIAWFEKISTGLGDQFELGKKASPGSGFVFGLRVENRLDFGCPPSPV
jgi:hypothetical protein